MGPVDSSSLGVYCKGQKLIIQGARQMKNGISMYVRCAATGWQEEINKHRQRPVSSVLCRGRAGNVRSSLRKPQAAHTRSACPLGKLVWRKILLFYQEFPVKQ